MIGFRAGHLGHGLPAKKQQNSFVLAYCLARDHGVRGTHEARLCADAKDSGCSEDPAVVHVPKKLFQGPKVARNAFGRYLGCLLASSESGRAGWYRGVVLNRMDPRRCVGCVTRRR